MPEADNVKVCVRVRPLNEKEKREGNQKVVSVDKLNGNISVRNPNASADEPPKNFSFDHVFGDDSKQLDIYNLIARPILEAVLEGYNGTVFAYGQTGTGKTFTMEGVRDKPELRGIIPNSFAHVFGHIAKQEGDIKFLVRVSYLEIYNEEVIDLLGKNQDQHLEVKERPDIGVYVKDLSSVVCHNADDMERIMNVGNRNRSVGATQMNERSSRSHAIFSITIECSDRGPDGAQRLRAGKLHLVDLAGSERQSKTGATGIRLKEATKINLSLSTLGNVISALVDGKSTHIPYRNSKLTRLLQDSLGGNSKTVMVANVGPADYNYDESISTLRYATRAKSIKNHAHINEDPKDALMRQYEKELAELKKQLGEAGALEDDDGDDDDEDVEEYVDESGKKVRRKKVSPEKMDEIQAKIKEELRKVAAIKNIEEAERNKIARKLEKRLDELKKAQEEQRLISEKIEAFERKIIVGGENLLEKAEEQAKLLEDSERQLEKQREKQKQMKQKLDEKEEEKLQLEEKYANLNEEAQSKTKKLKKLKTMILQAQSEVTDIKTEHQRAMEGLLEIVREMSKELKLNMAIIDSYIPSDFQEIIEENVIWNEELGEWQLKCIAYTGNNMRKPKEKEIDKSTYRVVDFNHVYLSYTAEGAEKAMKDFQRAKSAKDKKKKGAKNKS
ncbi:unnamed protein product [Brachionus calyciflorus]|uniref:Kinesin-like protein n=1 Tax=Brachionus calyciflorus TaxID=104777 RepID=A0A813VD51_9BILA|nr:unnamed protein product [Brachionus calyciflorus]